MAGNGDISNGIDQLEGMEGEKEKRMRCSVALTR